MISANVMETNMRDIFEKWLVNALITFVLRQVKKFTTEVQWDKLKEDASARVRDLVPGEWFDDHVSSIAVTVLATCEHALKSENRLEKILLLLAEDAKDGKPDYEGAAIALKSYLMKSWEAVQADLEVTDQGKGRAYAHIESFKPLA